MKIINLFLVFLAVACATQKKSSNLSTNLMNEERDFISIFQGATSSTKTVINFLVPENFTYQASVYLNQKAKPNIVKKVTEHKHKTNPWRVIEYALEGLELNQEYEFHVSITKGNFEYKDIRVFTALDTNKIGHNILVGSCMSDAYNDVGANFWRNLAKKEVDAYFMIGDLVYADLSNGRYIGLPVQQTNDIWNRYVQTRNTVDFYRMKRLRPVFSLWDDHDLGMNDATKEYVYLQEATKIFRQFYPTVDDKMITKGVGGGFQLKLGQHYFYFLDNRSFRDNNKNPAGEHLGSKQSQWLYQQLRQNEGLHWLILGDQFFGRYHPFESFEGNHPVAFNKFVAELKKINKQYVFLSGDRHLYEFMTIDAEVFGKKTYEITTSSIHAKLFPRGAEQFPNPRRTKIIDDQYNILLLQLTGTQNQLKLFNDKDQMIDQQQLTFD
jgi:alkaline phosphatase D